MPKKSAMLMIVMTLLLCSCEQDIPFAKIVRLAENVPEAPAAFTISLDTVTGGTAVISPLKESYEAGEFIHLSAEATDGFAFAGWSGTIKENSNPLVLTVTDSEWIIPVFTPVLQPEAEPETWRIRIDEVSGGTASVSPAQEFYRSGEYVRFAAVPDSGYQFAGWSGTISGLTNPLVITVERSEWIIPAFTKVVAPVPDPEPVPVTYTIRVDTSTGGTVTVDPVKPAYTYGEYVHVIANPRSDFQFDGWSGTSDGSATELFLTVTGNIWLIPHFSRIPAATLYSLTTSTSGSGTILRNPDKSSYAPGETVSLTAVPSEGSRFHGWSGLAGGTETSCTVTMNGNSAVTAQFERREWTVVVYMSADNDLESAAIQDFNEIEAAHLNDFPGDVLVLLDRNPSYDSTNGDWSDTRLFHVAEDSSGNNTVIQSPRISCPSLGIGETGSIEIDLSRPETLSYLLSHARAAYPADRYGLIVWGHGTGWRGSGSPEASGVAPFKAMAIDDTSGGYMTIREAGTALAGQGLTTVGFDTCFGALIETAYELRNRAEWLIGSEGVTPSTGWNYTNLFNWFAGSGRTAEDLNQSAISQFRSQYSTTPNASIAAIDLSCVDGLYDKFEAFSLGAASCITDSTMRDNARSCLLTGCTLAHFPVYPCDAYIDIASLAGKITDCCLGMVADPPARTVLSSNGTALLNSIQTAIPVFWNQDSGNMPRIGVHLIPFIAASTPKSSHDAGYIQGSGAANQSQFVLESTGWVPNLSASRSFLDVIFYEAF